MTINKKYPITNISIKLLRRRLGQVCWPTAMMASTETIALSTYLLRSYGATERQKYISNL